MDFVVTTTHGSWIVRAADADAARTCVARKMPAYFPGELVKVLAVTPKAN